MELRKPRQEYRAIDVQDADSDDDTGSSFTDASDISWEEATAGSTVVDVNLDSLLPLNTAAMLEEACVMEEGASQFLNSAPELEVADVEFELLEDSELLVAADSSLMRVSAVESRTCWPLQWTPTQVVQSSTATVLLRPMGPQSMIRGSFAAESNERKIHVPPPKPPKPMQSIQQQQQQPPPHQRNLLAMLMQPKVVPHNPEMHTVELPERLQRRSPPRVSLADRLASAAAAATGLQFRSLTPPPMSRCEKVPYLHGFHLGDTYQLQAKLWLLPQLLCGALALTGILLTLVGIIMLQINKYLVALCSTPGESLHCKVDEETQESITSVTMSIGVGTAGGGLSLILICAIVFLHAFCVIYDEGEHHKSKNQENVSLHVPAAACHINMFDLTGAVGQASQDQQQHQQQHQQQQQQHQQQREEQEQQRLQSNTEEVKSAESVEATNLVRCQSHYDNLQEVADEVI